MNNSVDMLVLLPGLLPCVVVAYLDWGLCRSMPHSGKCRRRNTPPPLREHGGMYLTPLSNTDAWAILTGVLAGRSAG